ncbi:IS607 family transposase [Candidatus Parabeggiatoa sp. HSG14]|uniref:IS607 family transposase n=1 Tax=Candidatus Parabeggiatoa sp. HSG14 TaxID=3055593 RepID=UPI0025A7600B|nr:IS607 family transposase [Thiotrichales bacterium HSG14]
MKLSQWAKEKGIHYRTAWEHFRKGKIPGAYRLETGTIIVPNPLDASRKKDEFVVTYARVNSYEDKNDLEQQSEKLIQFCNARGWQTHLNIKEVGSGFNDSRKKLDKVLKEGKLTKLVIEHKDRLAVFGVRYVELLCHHLDCELIFLNVQENDKKDLEEDFMAAILQFCTRIYGQRCNKHKIEQLLKELILTSKEQDFKIIDEV